MFITVSVSHFTPAPWQFSAENTLRASLDMGTDQLTLTIATFIYNQDTISKFTSPMLLLPNASWLVLPYSEKLNSYLSQMCTALVSDP